MLQGSCNDSDELQVYMWLITNIFQSATADGGPMTIRVCADGAPFGIAPSVTGLALRGVGTVAG
jgi:hypothetical protein